MENARKSLYLIVITLSEVHIQRVHFEPEAPVLIDLVMLMRVTNIETCNAKRVYCQHFSYHNPQSWFIEVFVVNLVINDIFH